MTLYLENLSLNQPFSRHSPGHSQLFCVQPHAVHLRFYSLNSKSTSSSGSKTSTTPPLSFLIKIFRFLPLSDLLSFLSCFFFVCWLVLILAALLALLGMGTVLFSSSHQNKTYKCLCQRTRYFLIRHECLGIFQKTFSIFN